MLLSKQNALDTRRKLFKAIGLSGKLRMVNRIFQNILDLISSIAVFTAIGKVFRGKLQQLPQRLPIAAISGKEVDGELPAERPGHQVASWHQLTPNCPQILSCCLLQISSASFNAFILGLATNALPVIPRSIKSLALQGAL